MKESRSSSFNHYFHAYVFFPIRLHIIWISVTAHSLSTSFRVRHYEYSSIPLLASPQPIARTIYALLSFSAQNILPLNCGYRAQSTFCQPKNSVLWPLCLAQNDSMHQGRRPRPRWPSPRLWTFTTLWIQFKTSHWPRIPQFCVFSSLGHVSTQLLRVWKCAGMLW